MEECSGVDGFGVKSEIGIGSSFLAACSVGNGPNAIVFRCGASYLMGFSSFRSNNGKAVCSGSVSKARLSNGRYLCISGTGVRGVTPRAVIVCGGSERIVTLSGSAKGGTVTHYGPRSGFSFGVNTELTFRQLADSRPGTSGDVGSATGRMCELCGSFISTKFARGRTFRLLVGVAVKNVGW